MNIDAEFRAQILSQRDVLCVENSIVQVILSRILGIHLKKGIIQDIHLLTE